MYTLPCAHRALREGRGWRNHRARQLLPSVYIRAEFYLRNMSWNADIEVFPALVVSVRLSSPRLINNTVPAASTQAHVAAVNTI